MRPNAKIRENFVKSFIATISAAGNASSIAAPTIVNIPGEYKCTTLQNYGCTLATFACESVCGYDEIDDIVAFAYIAVCRIFI
jgi:hypothetical protein